MMLPRYKLVTFGDGSLGWRLAAERLIAEAKKSGLFRSYETYGLRDILGSHPTQPSREFFLGTRGLGYWSWKPLVISKALRELPSYYDGIVYIDSGCTLNHNPVADARMVDYFEMSQSFEGLAFQMPENLESHWTKIDLAVKLGLVRSSSWQTGQLVGGINFWKTGERSRTLAREWVDLCFAEGFRFLDDSASSQVESKGFVEHRHDQSIFSLLAKQSQQFGLLTNESEWSPDWLTQGADFPIWASRHRSGLDFKRSQRGSQNVWLRRSETALVLACDTLAKVSR